MEFEFQLTAEDWRQFCLLTNKRLVASAFPGRRLFWLQILVFIPFGMGVAATFTHFQRHGFSRELDLVWALVFFTVWGLALFLRARHVNARYEKHSVAADGTFTQKQHIRVDESGISVTKQTSEHRYRWAAIRDIFFASNAVCLYLDANSALLVPHRAFGDQLEVTSFCERVKGLANASKSLHSTSN